MIYFKTYVLNNFSFQILGYFVRRLHVSAFLPWSLLCYVWLVTPSCSLCVAFAPSENLVPKRLDMENMDMYIYMHVSRISTERYIHLSWWDKIAPLPRKTYAYMNALFCSSLLLCIYSLIRFHWTSFSPREFYQG